MFFYKKSSGGLAMPTYDYRCDACGHSEEIFQSIKARPIKKCPTCGKNKMVRLIGSGGGIIFKGSGFYETDDRSESYKAQAKKETCSSSGSSSTSSSSSSGCSGCSKNSSSKNSSKPKKDEGKPKKEDGNKKMKAAG